MNSKKTIKVGGVHEYTNILFIYALMRGYFIEAGIDLQWKIYPSGSAPLAQALKDDELDLAVILTDSVVKSMAGGAPIKIVSPYVLSPLDWVFHVMKGSDINEPKDMIGKRFAISKHGSGGHLISMYWAKQRGVTLTEANFVVVNNMEGAVTALENNLADVFPWERLTTLHLVEQKIFKEIDHVETPYPPFSIACSQTLMQNDPDTIRTVLEIIHRSAVEFKCLDNASIIISAVYHRNLLEVEKSFAKLKWAEDSNFQPGTINNVAEILFATGAINSSELELIRSMDL